MNGLATEEQNIKKDYTKLIIVILIILLVGGISFGVYKYVEYKKEQDRKEKERIKKLNPLNDELQDLYGFGVRDNYIVAIKKDGTLLNIYNLLQGTGIFGDFKNFFYNNKKLYLIFSDNNIYSINLAKGNKIYELEKDKVLDKVNCLNNSSGLTSDLAFSNNTMYTNNSSCALTMIKKDSKTKKEVISLIKTYNTPGVDIEYNNGLLFTKADNKIEVYDIKNKNTVVVADNINSDIPIV